MTECNARSSRAFRYIGVAARRVVAIIMAINTERTSGQSLANRFCKKVNSFMSLNSDANKVV